MTKSTNTVNRFIYCTIAALILLSPRLSNACGYWEALDLEMGWIVAFNCASKTSAIEARTREGVRVFYVGGSEVTEKWDDKDGALWFEGKQAGTIAGNKFVIAGKSYRFIPCEDVDTPCKDEPQSARLMAEDAEIMRAIECKMCFENAAARMATYLLFKDAFMSETTSRFQKDGQYQQDKLEHAFRKRDVRAAVVLANQGKEALPFLKKILKDKRSHRRLVQLVFYTLSRMGEPARELIPEVETKLNRGPSNSVRSQAASLLVELNATAAIDSLIATSQNAPYQARIGAIEALGEMGVVNDTVVKALLKALKDPTPGIRIRAARALGALKHNDPKIITALEWRADKDGIRVSKPATEALEQIRAAHPDVETVEPKAE